MQGPQKVVSQSRPPDRECGYQKLSALHAPIVGSALLQESLLVVFLKVHLERNMPRLYTHSVFSHCAIRLFQLLPDLLSPEI